MTDQEPARFDTKIAIVLREDLPVWQKLNMTAFLASGVAHTAAESVGEAYCDGDGTKYLQGPAAAWLITATGPVAGSGVRFEHRGTNRMRAVTSNAWPPGPPHCPVGPKARPGPTCSGGGVGSMATTAWRFSGTEGADDAVLRLKQLDTQELIDVQDVAVLRWPQYAAGPLSHEHVTDEGSKVSSLVHKLRHPVIDSSMIASVMGDMVPGTSALVLLSTDAAIDKVVMAFEGRAMELIRSDLSVQQQDRLRAAFSGPAQTRPAATQEGDR
jgi:uncharacterized membrane protein